MNHLIGNAQAKQLIEGYIASGHMPHALTVFGPQGIGKKTFCKQAAKMVLCHNIQKGGIPCGHCKSCEKIEKGVHPDVIFVLPEKNGKLLQTIGVDTVRWMIKDSCVMPNEAEKKIYILPGETPMTPQAQNAFLKTLEEPNQYSMFFICCCAASQLLETVLSRTAHIVLSPLDFTAFEHALTAAKPENGKDAAMPLFELTGGILGQAVRMLEDGLYQKVRETSVSLLLALAKKDEYGALCSFYRLKGDTEQFELCLRMLVLLLRDCVVYQSGGTVILQHETQIIMKAAGHLTKHQILCMIETLHQCGENARCNCSENLNLTQVCAALFSPVPGMPG